MTRIKSKREIATFVCQYNFEMVFLFMYNTYHWLTISKKKSTCGLLWTKNLTGCLSIVTLRTKSGGVPGLTVGLATPSWWEWINVSSKSNTNTFLLTIPERFLHYTINNIKRNVISNKIHASLGYLLSLCLDKGESGKISYLTGCICEI